MKKRKRYLTISILLALVACMAVLILRKKANINQSLISSYSIRGIDVSHYQGEIDWKVISKQKVNFAFIKATEGSGCVDEFFSDNWKEAKQNEIVTGAYHFFSFDSSAENQAKLYIQTVGDLSGCLVPVIDVEYYADKEKNPPSVDEVVPELQRLLTLLEEHYQVKPMIYTTYKVYHRYLEGNFSDYPLWIRNVYYPPVDLDRKWTFWQYLDTGKLQGIQGAEQNVDMNVFYGKEAELTKYIVPEKK